MLKISDYFAMMLSFIALMIVYLILSGFIVPVGGTVSDVPTVELPEGFTLSDNVLEYRSERPQVAILCGQNGEDAQSNFYAELFAELKMDYNVYPTVADFYSEELLENLSTIVITADSWESVGDGAQLLSTAEREGLHLLFAGIPTESETSYNRSLGILSDNGTVDFAGVMVMDGLLVEGMLYYDNLEVQASDIRVDSRCRRWMSQYDRAVEQQDQIPLIWQRNLGNGVISVLNGDIFDGDAAIGIGVLSGLLAQTEDVYVYPVVNIRTGLLDSFPEPGNPYDAEILSLYSRNTYLYLRDIVWPTILKIQETYNLRFTVRPLVAPDLAHQQEFDTLVQMVRQRSYEVDDSFTDYSLEIPYAASGHNHNELDVLRMRCSVSGNGLASYYLDLSEAMGENADDLSYEWNAYSRELSTAIDDLYKYTDWLDSVNISQALERYKRYLLLRPTVDVEGDEIQIHTDNFNDFCYYMVRANAPVLSGSDYEVTKVGDGAYLIKVLAEDVSLRLGA